MKFLTRLWSRAFLELRPSVSLGLFRLAVAWTVAAHMLPAFLHMGDNYLATAFKTKNTSFFPLPLLGREPPKVPLLFPPAGWIMFFRVDAQYGFAEVYGVRRDTTTLLDPHAIFSTQAVGYDNIRRNMLVSVLYAQRAPAFCAYLRRKFPAFDTFAVVYAEHPDLVHSPDRVLRQVAYQCP